MSRSAALKSLYAVLEADAQLVAALNHRPGATTVEGGARIVADYARLQALPEPCLLLTLAPEVPSSAVRSAEMKRLQVSLQVYGADIFQVEDLVEILERIALAYRNDGLLGLPQRLLKLEFGAAAPIPFDLIRAQAPGKTVPITVIWA